MVRVTHIIYLCFLILLCHGAKAQDEVMVQRQGMLKASLTISPGILLRQTETNIYLHGHLEYYPENNVSLRGDSYLFIDSEEETGILSQNTSFVFGGLHHPNPGRLDFYYGFQPGVSITTINLKEGEENKISETKAIPLITLTAGANYFIGKNFNFFTSVSYVNGSFIEGLSSPVHLDELRFSFGLGFNLPTNRGAS